MKKLLLLVFIGAMVSCEKDVFTDFETPIFDPESGTELFFIDSVTTSYMGVFGIVNIYFRINHEITDEQFLGVSYFKMWRDGKFVRTSNKESQGVVSEFNINIDPGNTYSYQLSMIGKDGNDSKLTSPYLVQMP